MNEVGSRIKALRKSRRLNQTQLGEKISRDQSTISDIERGADFSAETLMRLAEKLDTTARYIMRGGTEADLYESELIALFRAMSESDQQHMLKLMRGLISQSGGLAHFRSTK